MDAYTLALAAVMLTAGSEADRAGARRLFTAGLAVFGADSAACAVAPTLGVLIAARAVQGLGASALSTGLLILPMSVAVGVGSTASGPLTARLGPKPPMITGFVLAAAGAALLAGAGAGTSLALIVAGSVLLGMCSLGMPAMTAVVVGSVGRERAGLASGILNAARQSGGALGVALLGALLAGSQHSGHGMALHLPLAVAAVGYLVAIGLTLVIRAERVSG